MRSPKQVELRAKARGLKVPIRIHRFAPLRHLAGARSRTHTSRCLDGTSSCDFFAAALEALQEGKTMTNRDHDHDHDRDPTTATIDDSENGGASPPAPTGGALAALTALGTVLNDVDMRPSSAVRACRCSRSRAGQQRHLDDWAEEDHRRRRQPLGRQPDVVPVRLHLLRRRQQGAGERLLPVSQPMPDVAELPDKGFEWQEQWAVNMKCLNGADAGTEVIFKADDRRRHPGRRRADRGGARSPQRRPARRQGLADRAAGEGRYPHPQYGKIWTPVLTIVDWMSLDGPAPAPAPPPTSPPSSAPSSRAAAASR